MKLPGMVNFHRPLGELVAPTPRPFRRDMARGMKPKRLTACRPWNSGDKEEEGDTSGPPVGQRREISSNPNQNPTVLAVLFPSLAALSHLKFGEKQISQIHLRKAQRLSSECEPGC